MRGKTECDKLYSLNATKHQIFNILEMLMMSIKNTKKNREKKELLNKKKSNH